MKKPKEIETGINFDYKKLWDLDIPVEEIGIEEISANMHFPYLEREGTDDWNLTPRMLIDNFEKESSHAAKVKKANSKFPIEIYLHNSSWIILDGVHRYVQAVMNGEKTIRVRKVTRAMLNKALK